MKRFLPLILVLFAFPALAEELRINGRVYTIEIAKTPAEQAQGLMHRPALAEDQGMLFLNEQDRVMRMWMKDTPLALDMLFIDKTGKIIYLVRSTTPLSEEIITTPLPVRAVLELAGGVTEKNHINTGDRVESSYFTP